jgi:hypothetical protein
LDLANYLWFVEKKIILVLRHHHRVACVGIEDLANHRNCSGRSKKINRRNNIFTNISIL